jgi:hypothetical protein
MRWPLLVVVIAAFGCGKKSGSGAGSGSAEPTGSSGPTPVKPPPEPAGSGSAEAVVTPPPPPAPGLVELLHNAPATVRVSSRVLNKQIQPEHVVDKNMNTAWHSRSGDLQGAFIDIDVPGAQIKEIRLTVGNIGKGIHGEDFFLMYPRIKTVSVRDGAKLVAQKTLEVENRALQPVVLATPASHVRVKVEEVQGGGKPSWHELPVSEIEAWGTLPAGAAAAPQQPRIEVGDPPDEAAIHVPIADADKFCTDLMKDVKAHYKEVVDAATKENEQCIKDHGDQAGAFCGAPEPPGEPQCSMSITMPVKVKKSNWMGAGLVQYTNDSTFGAKPMQIVVENEEGFWPVGDKVDCGGHGATAPCSLEVTSATIADSGNLVVAYHVKSPAGEKDGTLDCAAGANVTCSAK